MSHPGDIFAFPYQYNTRFPWGQGNIKVISLPAAEDIPTGVAVQIKPGTETVRVARDGWAMAGVSTYDPARHTTDVIYNQYDMVPIVRIGKVFARFTALLPPFRDPYPCEDAYFYATTGLFTTDLSAAIRLGGASFLIATKEFYQGISGSPQADVPLPVPPIPLGATSTTFGMGVCLVELNLG